MFTLAELNNQVTYCYLADRVDMFQVVENVEIISAIFKVKVKGMFLARKLALQFSEVTRKRNEQARLYVTFKGYVITY